MGTQPWFVTKTIEKHIYMFGGFSTYILSYVILMECRTHMPRNPKTKSEDLAFPEIHMEPLTNKIQPTNIDLCFHFRQPNWC